MRSFPVILLIWLMLVGPASAAEWTFVTEDFPPFTFPAVKLGPADAGAQRAGGPLAEVVQAVCARLGRECSITVHPWRRALHLAEEGQVDGIFTVVRSAPRERAFHISRMLVKSRYSIFARRETSFVYHQPSDLAGRMIGVYGPSGTSYILSQRLTPVDDVQVHLTADNRRLLRMLESGRFGEDGLAVLNHDVAWDLIEDEHLNGIREAGVFSTVSYGIGLSRKRFSDEQFQRFEAALVGLIADGTVPAILRHYQLEPAY
jgi:polar amino acid transport system substrate-binding protein